MTRALVLLVLAASATGAAAVGLGPLRKAGITDGPAKAFYLTLINPYPHAERFTMDAHPELGETPADRVAVFPADVRLAANRSRQLLVIVKDLAPGETYALRVCAQKPPLPEETVHARVCSTLVARRLPVGGRHG